MKVGIKNFSVSMDVKRKGVEFDVYDNDLFLGDMIVTNKGLIWCKGKVRRENGILIEWSRFIEMASKIAQEKQ